MMNHRVAQIYVRSEKSGALTNRHPWVWDRSIVEPSIPLSMGTVVDLCQVDGKWIGRGIYNPTSHIRVRLYQWSEPQPMDDAWLQSRLATACELRDQWQRVHGRLDAVRLVNSEGDCLSGLVIERFGDYAVVQLTAAGIQHWLPTIARWLTERYQLQGVWLRIDEKMATIEGMTADQSLLSGATPTGPIVIKEHGVEISLDMVSGQKTGYYLDQRTNRLRAAAYMRGRMLDVCTYLGGFSLTACKQGQVDEVIAVDMSTRALALARHNAELNGFKQIQFVKGDCFEELERLVDAGEQFDSIVLDPPRLAGSREHKSAALRAYHRLNLMAMRLLRPGGTLVTCSCSGRINRDEFLGTLAACARRVDRAFQILEVHGADFDHPMDVACPESEYLKCVIGRIG